MHKEKERCVLQETQHWNLSHLGKAGLLQWSRCTSPIHIVCSWVDLLCSCRSVCFGEGLAWSHLTLWALCQRSHPIQVCVLFFFPSTTFITVYTIMLLPYHIPVANSLTLKPCLNLFQSSMEMGAEDIFVQVFAILHCTPPPIARTRVRTDLRCWVSRSGRAQMAIRLFYNTSH